jgi:hypothetical protein
VSEFEFEEIPGLPEALPEGEKILWRGAPSWRGMAWRAFHVRDVLAYFGLVFLLRVALSVWHGEAALVAIRAEVWMAPVCALACAVLCGLGWASARTTIYTMTDRRLVLRTGMALPTTVNLPFAQIANAHLRLLGGGTGDITIAFSDNTRLAWLVLWPHVRPWHPSKPEPMLRSVPDAEQVADTLSLALAQAAGPGAFVRTIAGTTDAPRAPAAVLSAGGGVGAAT